MDILAKAKLEEELGRSLEQDKLIEAVIAAQEKMRVLEDAKGNRNSYVSIEEIVEKTQPHLRAQGLWMEQDYNFVNEHFFLDSVLNHKSGQWKRSRLPLPKIILKELTQSEANSVSQAVGTMTTYFKRYAYASMLGLRIGEDDPDSIPTKQPQKSQNYSEKQPERISDQQYSYLTKVFNAAPDLENILKEHFGLKDLKWLYASKWNEAIEIIKENLTN